MRTKKIIFGTLTAAALLFATVSSADARGFRHRGPGPVLGLLGGVVVGAATIATLPFALLADAGRSGYRRSDDYGGRYDYEPSPQNYYSRGGYDGYYGPPPPPPPPPRYYREYGPPPGYDRDGYGY